MEFSVQVRAAFEAGEFVPYFQPIVRSRSREVVGFEVLARWEHPQRGVMIRFVAANNRIRLRINADAAKAAGLSISSKLLRPAELVTSAG